ncbi:MAG: hypothetical protein HQM10_10955 [Candidatus Riflebacteria bacterium]|nr:hypothetical protein [Candidatus Riflebacteria bacterium]
MRYFCFILVFLLTALCCSAQTLAQPDFARLELERASISGFDKPQWIDATSIFHDMAVEAADKFEKITGKPKKDGVPIGGEEEFWAMNVATKQFERVTAVLRKISNNSYLYVEKGQEVEEDVLNGIAQKFDEVIYPKDRFYFGSEPKPGIDGDNRVTILMLDIKDGWEPGKGYVGGYFFPLNEYSTKDFAQSNEREMVYLDMYPSDPKDPEYLGVVAHEFQHLIHWNNDPKEDKWINEGCSQLSFNVCGYPHPGQIMAFAQNPDHNLAKWDNTVDGYGAVYLFFYYMTQKYQPLSGVLSKEIVLDQGKSIEGLNSALNKVGITVDFKKLFSDWIVANIVSDPSINNGKYGYDQTLPVKVLSKTIAAETTAAPVKEAVQGWSADYFQATTESFWKPANPTLADVVEISKPGLGAVIWTLDDGKIPPQSFWPPQTRQLSSGKALMTKIPAGSNMFKVGPFTAFPAEKLSLSLYNSDFIPIDHAQVKLEKDNASISPKSGKFAFSIKGKKSKGTVEVKLVTYSAANSAPIITPVALDADNSGTCEVANFGTDVKRAVLIVGNLADKDFEYELSTVFTPAQPALAQLIDGLVRGQELMDIMKPQMANNSELLGNLYTSVIQEYSDLVKNAVSRLDPTENTEAAAEYETLSNLPRNPALQPLLKVLSEKASFGAQHGQKWSSEITETINTIISESDSVESVSASNEPALSMSVRDDDGDTSHTNLIYLCNKKAELINLLTNLKIDPKFLEGEIIKMYKLLQLQLNLPNIPLPNGLALVNYKEESAKKYIEGLLANGATDQQKESLKRLTVAEELTERLYNDNLTMAEDFGLCLYDTARLVLSARATLLSVASGLSNVPGAGPLIKKVINQIIGKALGIVVRATNLMAVKLKSPYNTIVPIAVQLGASVAAKALKVQLDEKDSWIKPWAAKTVAKYVFASVPKFGYVAMTQDSVDAGVPMAIENNFGGDYNTAVKTVLDDGNPQAFTSVYENFANNLNVVHNKTGKEVEYSKIAKAVAQIAAYATLIDPTNISKVVGVLAVTVSGGALTHGMINSLTTFYKTPAILAQGVQKAFHPERAVEASEMTVNRIPAADVRMESSVKGLTSFYSDYQKLISRVKEAYQASKVQEIANLAVEMVAFEEAIEADEKAVSDECDSLLAGSKSEKYLDSLNETSVKCDMARMDVLGSMIQAIMGKMPDASFVQKADNAALLMNQKMDQVSNAISKSDGEIAPKVSIVQTTVTKVSAGWRVKSVVKLISSKPSTVAFTLYGAADTSIYSAPSKKVLYPNEKVAVEWLISGNSNSSDMPVTISAESDDHIPAIDFTILN